MNATVVNAHACTKDELEAFDYLMGWWETHPEEYPTTLEEFKQCLEEAKEMKNERPNT